MYLAYLFVLLSSGADATLASSRIRLSSFLAALTFAWLSASMTRYNLGERQEGARPLLLTIRKVGTRFALAPC